MAWNDIMCMYTLTGKVEGGGRGEEGERKVEGKGEKGGRRDEG